jgi:SAM-dependent methyltransferase
VSWRRAIGVELLSRVRLPRDRGCDRIGDCSVCGRRGRFAFNSWILPADLKRDLGDARLVDAFVARESLLCRGCGANLRIRRIADVLLEHYAHGARTLVELLEERPFRSLAVAEINRVGSIHPLLAVHPGLVYSEFRPGAKPGALVDGVRNEDVCRLTYADASFDLVLTSDTLEHVPDLGSALGETRRILAPGGRHVFTVPVVPSRRSSVRRATLAEDGSVVHRAPPRHHARGSGPLGLVGRRADQLVFTDVGMDIADAMRAAGLEPEVHFLDPADPDADAAIVFCGVAV